jgi:predicted anti-sigma-YlaC factor YlaD
MLLKHPTRTQLITYAEALVDGRGPIFSGIARHLTQCPQCSAEVEAICSSLRFLNSAPTVEPPKELALEILKRAREQKKQHEHASIPVKRYSPVLVIICVLVWLTLGYFLFIVGYNPSVQDNLIGKQIFLWKGQHK